MNDKLEQIRDRIQTFRVSVNHEPDDWQKLLTILEALVDEVSRLDNELTQTRIELGELLLKGNA